MVKNPTVSVGDIRDTGLIPGLEVVQSKIFHFVVGNEIFKVLWVFLAISLGLWDLSSLTRD